MRLLSVTVCLLLLALCAYGQLANGTITGTITDPAGAVVANAMVEAKSIDTGVAYPTQSTSTGNYTIINLPVGNYELTVTVTGFKTYDRKPIIIQAAQVVAVNVPLEVGTTGETVTVTAESTLLKTETGDLVHDITLQQLDELPILGIGTANAGSSGVRNPFNSVEFLPGVSYTANSVMVVNGAPNNTASYRVEGQDATNHTVSFALQEVQPSADAIQEVAIQTSNYAAEFGAAGGGLFNVTMKSGTNEYHGSGYDYFVNEFLNAGDPFSYQNANGGGGKVTPRNRRNDFGGTLGGPIDIPHVYNGHNKTFFFFSYEEYLETTALNAGPGSFLPQTLPTAAYRQGNFSSIDPLSPNFNPATGVPTNPLPSKDAAGNPIYAGVIYDPNTRTTINGVGYATPFPGNIIPSNRFSPMALAVQNLIPAPCNGNPTQNGCGSQTSNRGTTIPSLKVDQIVGSKGKLAFYWSSTGTDSQYAYPNGNADGLPPEITIARGTFIHSYILRLNYDYTLTPTLLLHLGAGYQRNRFFDDGPVKNFNCTAIDLQGCQISEFFPTFTSMVGNNSTGGMQQMGNAQAHTHTWTERPSYNANITSIKGNHTYKFGGEVWFQGAITQPPSGATLTFGTNATALPFNPPQGLGNGFMGFPYASFLLGDLGGTTGFPLFTPQASAQEAPTDTRMGKGQWALFAQDSWKVTRTLTLDYGLRWDYATLPVEQYGRSADFSPTTLNPAVGIDGAPIFQANCHCSFAGNYPLAFGPRLGLAYQITPKTVLRAGWGLLYGFGPDLGVSTSANQINAASASTPNGFVPVTAPGALPQPVWPNFSPGQTPLPGQTTAFSGLALIDGNYTRPGRQNQWSIGIQRELATNLVVEASYVANRGVWWAGGGEQNLGYLNQVSPARFAAYGLYPYTNPADNLLLNDPINNPAVIARVGNIMPYAGFPTGTSLLNALRPFPQFSSIAVIGAPTGDTWYDSMQAKVTKRLSHGLLVNGSFTWSKALQAVREDLFNPASSTKTYQSTDQPFLFNANILYTTPSAPFLNKWENTLIKDWQVGLFVQYGSGVLLQPPAALDTVNPLTGNSTGAPSYELRVPGQPLYLKNPNCGCINPYTDQILNPKAWADPAPGTFGGSAYYGDFRGPWYPIENFNFGRNFRIKERMNLEIRAEFTNIFNRTFLGSPTAGAVGFTPSTNAKAPIGRNAAGQITSGFGIINATAVYGTNGPPLAGQPSLPREGTIVARFTF
jgi:hypothetical protein